VWRHATTPDVRAVSRSCADSIGDGPGSNANGTTEDDPGGTGEYSVQQGCDTVEMHLFLLACSLRARGLSLQHLMTVLNAYTARTPAGLRALGGWRSFPAARGTAAAAAASPAQLAAWRSALRALGHHSVRACLWHSTPPPADSVAALMFAWKFVCGVIDMDRFIRLHRRLVTKQDDQALYVRLCRWRSELAAGMLSKVCAAWAFHGSLPCTTAVATVVPCRTPSLSRPLPKPVALCADVAKLVMYAGTH
jgi:hypothetical protein